MERRTIIVGVHGIGDQSSFETIQAIARQVCKYYQAPGAIPLGRFQPSHTSPAPPPFFPQNPPDPLLPHPIGFAEVYWADIPRCVAKRGYTLEEAKRWAKTIVDRLRLNYPDSFTPRDYRTIKRVLEEMIDTIAVLERLLFLADKAGLFSFNLKKLLDDYLGDVQLVTEFTLHRQKILDRFFVTMEGIHNAAADAEIQIVAHSEGTVVTFLALLEAMCADPASRPAWLSQVRGLMTIGSPIDKHLLLWPELWRPFEGLQWNPRPEERIRWLNYYDYGDPVGFMLDTARLWLQLHGGTGFAFGEGDDFGYSRYYLPGKAHMDYWDDDYLFGHFLSRVVAPVPSEQRYDARPGNAPGARLATYLVPYAVIAILLFGAVYLLYKSVAFCIGTETAPMAIIRNVTGISLLLAGITVSARIPRLTRKRSLYLVGPALFLGAVLTYPLLVEPGLRASMGGFFAPLGIDPTAGVLILASAILTLTTLIGGAFPKGGMKPLLIGGGCAAGGIVASVILGDADHRAVWPILPAAAAFLYLWWLAALLFDLTFVWQRYIRQAKGIIHLNKLYRASTAAASAQK